MENTTELKTWEPTRNRFVAFFDIMGFKDIVERNTHIAVIEKLRYLKEQISTLEKINNNTISDISISETKSFTFSDSIILFSHSDTVQDANKIIIDSFFIIKQAIEFGIGIKGALSYGKLTVDFTNSLFFGRPIIDSYLLHDQLQLYSAVLDNNIEKKISGMKLHDTVNNLLYKYKAQFKSSKITHLLIKPHRKDQIDEQIKSLETLYHAVSGPPRIYIDNTIDFLKSI